MSYCEENDQVILTMSREDYDMLQMLLGYATSRATRRFKLDRIFELLNRLNQGNPNYTPY